MDERPPLSLYLHMPWCMRKCPYCDFNSHQVPDAGLPERAYLDALRLDLDAERARLGSGPVPPVRSIFIGGGTPSLFSGAAIMGLLQAVRSGFALVPDAEITLEANPGTVDEAHFAGYLEAGVNRLSIGVQSLSDKSLRRLGRIHGAGDAWRAVAAARAAGLENINLDLMFALPGQTLVGAQEDLEGLMALEPTHISYYELTLEPNTAFYRQPPGLPDPDLADAIQQQGLSMLKAAGYQRYEVSAFARPGRRCQHNLNYWRFGDYLGVGAGAHGKYSDPSTGRVQRRSKLRHPNAYVAACASAEPTSSVRVLSDLDLVLEFALNGFRLVEGFSARHFEAYTGLSAERLVPGLERAGALGLVWQRPGDGRIGATPKGFAFLNDLVGCFSS